ncbi:hypothetical protein ACPWT1_16210 [Ramlibacter sp. MMS24-I3-19]|uniref:hypothetical protein n=1 Tax=Ramlibacter sp. MMS24-I3-19 TaxID=3416606 RepID=UPI003D021F2E
MDTGSFGPATPSRWPADACHVRDTAVDLDVAVQHAPLHLRVLRTASDREAIAGLRQHAAFGVEQDLGLGLKPLEETRDEAGVVVAVYRHSRLLATLRFVPTGHRLTGAERLLNAFPFDTSILGDGSWEVGRVIMDPEDRRLDLLVECLALTLEKLMQLKHVRHFHATTTLAMARLWRRVGMRTVVTATGTSGTRYALVHARVEDVASALQQLQSRTSFERAALVANGW